MIFSTRKSYKILQFIKEFLLPQLFSAIIQSLHWRSKNRLEKREANHSFHFGWTFLPSDVLQKIFVEFFNYQKPEKEDFPTAKLGTSQFILSSAAFLFISLGCLSPADNVGDTFQGLSRAHRAVWSPLASVLRPGGVLHHWPTPLCPLRANAAIHTFTALWVWGWFLLDMIFRFTGNFTNLFVQMSVWICRRTVTTDLMRTLVAVAKYCG